MKPRSWHWNSDHQSDVPPNSLDEDEVHIWQATLPAGEQECEHLETLLDPAERDRAGRYRFRSDRQQYVSSRGLLRTLLGHYLDFPAHQVRIGCHPQGKPFVYAPLQESVLHFNLSHTTHLVVLAFSRRYQLGIDVEHEDRMADWPCLAARILSPREKAELEALPPQQQRRAFYHGWTRKEAFLKAIGEGLIDRMDAIEVTLSPAQPARLLRIHGQPPPEGEWSMHDLAIGDRYVATLVTHSSQSRACVLCPLR